MWRLRSEHGLQYANEGIVRHIEDALKGTRPLTVTVSFVPESSSASTPKIRHLALLRSPELRVTLTRGDSTPELKFGNGGFDTPRASGNIPRTFGGSAHSVT